MPSADLQNIAYCKSRQMIWYSLNINNKINYKKVKELYIFKVWLLITTNDSLVIYELLSSKYKYKNIDLNNRIEKFNGNFI